MEKTKIYHYMRVLHRDLGFLAIGLALVYSLSGIVLVYRNTDFMKTEKTIEKTLSPGMSADELGAALKMRNFKATGEDGDVVSFANGSYNKTTGVANYTSKELIFPLNKFIELHKVTGQNGVHWFAVLFAVILLFLAISSFWMFAPKTKQFKRGIALAAVGFVCIVILLMLV